eukprot:6179728-Pleurochrysis_carterae.AAC.2
MDSCLVASAPARAHPCKWKGSKAVLNVPRRRASPQKPPTTRPDQRTFLARCTPSHHESCARAAPPPPSRMHPDTSQTPPLATFELAALRALLTCRGLCTDPPRGPLMPSKLPNAPVRKCAEIERLLRASPAAHKTQRAREAAQTDRKRREVGREREGEGGQEGRRRDGEGPGGEEELCVFECAGSRRSFASHGSRVTQTMRTALPP